jgi:hypothetical protein
VHCELLRREIYLNKQTRIINQGSYTISGIEETIEVSHQEPLLGEMQAFITFCRGQQVNVPTIKDAVASIDVCEKIREQILN